MGINIEELEQVGIYEYISRHYWEMSREQLAIFCKEICYAAEEYFMHEYGYKLGRERYSSEVEGPALEEIKEQCV